jgi:hypothetical protein
MNASNHPRLALPKPRKPVKRMRTRPKPMSAKRRKEAAVIARVRKACVERDGHCRVQRFYPACSRVSTWAHLGEWRRSQTRGMAPEARHHTKGSLMLCEAHHKAYDLHQWDISYGPNGADGPIVVHKNSGVAVREIDMRREESQWPF